MDIETAHDFIGGMRLSVGDAYHFVAGRLPLKILSVSNGFLRDSFPHTEEYLL